MLQAPEKMIGIHITSHADIVDPSNRFFENFQATTHL